MTLVARPLVLSLCGWLLLALAACAAPTSQPPAAPAAPGITGTQAVKLDRSCASDADCAVKNIGNCCGRYPACVNKDSPVDPAAVQAQCARQGMMSACGFREISACSCRQGQCQPQDAAIAIEPAR